MVTSGALISLWPDSRWGCASAPIQGGERCSGLPVRSGWCVEHGREPSNARV